MNELVKKWLFDMIEAINSINDYIGTPRQFIDYENNKQLRRSVEREIEIIGEAVNRIKKEMPELEIINSKQINATRNRVAHAYDAVDNAIIWGIVINHLPGLKQEVEQLLNQE
ncbi:MAG: hypothetical protein DRI95_14730 [Bacteroidetes bacterium]|nr:MAG: hypothetical protein DRI95_14730 [Bacteroidota bacterium]